MTQYIASQAPLDSTCDDHWQLVWEQKVELIVMLTKERERQMVRSSGTQGTSGELKLVLYQIKAHRYWPEEKTTQQYHEISVHHAQCGEEEGSMIRKFILTRGRESRTVHHIQHAEWPDHGALEVEDMVHLFNVYRRLRSKSSGPVLVHCSAGIGRTGTFIAIDMLLDNLAKHTTGTIDIFDLVQRLRKQRPGSVQTPVSYCVCMLAKCKD